MHPVCEMLFEKNIVKICLDVAYVVIKWQQENHVHNSFVYKLEKTNFNIKIIVT